GPPAPRAPAPSGVGLHPIYTTPDASIALPLFRQGVPPLVRALLAGFTTRVLRVVERWARANFRRGDDRVAEAVALCLAMVPAHGPARQGRWPALVSQNW